MSFFFLCHPQAAKLNNANLVKYFAKPPDRKSLRRRDWSEVPLISHVGSHPWGIFLSLASPWNRERRRVRKQLSLLSIFLFLLLFLLAGARTRNCVPVFSGEAPRDAVANSQKKSPWGIVSALGFSRASLTEGKINRTLAPQLIFIFPLFHCLV